MLKQKTKAGLVLTLQHATKVNTTNVLKVLWHTKVRKCMDPFGLKKSLETIFSGNATGYKLFALRQCQIVAKVVGCAQLWKKSN